MTKPANKFNNAIKDTLDGFRAIMPGIIPRPLKLLKERQTSQPQKVIVLNEAGEIVGETMMSSAAEIRSETDQLQLDKHGVPRPKTGLGILEAKRTGILAGILEKLRIRIEDWRNPAPKEPDLPPTPETPPDTGMQPPTPTPLKVPFDPNAILTSSALSKSKRVSDTQEIVISG